MASYECRGKKKLWSVRFQIIEDGKEITKRLSGYERKRDAEMAYNEFIMTHKTKNIEAEQTESKKLKDFVPEYMDYKSKRLKESSMVEIKSIIFKYILPYFGETNIKDITKIKILDWQNSLTVSYAHKCKIRTMLYSFFKYLSMYYDIDNVVAKVEGFRQPKTKKEMMFWTLEEFNQFIKVVKDGTWFAFFNFLYWTGCRLGEVLALNISDIDFNKQILNISKSKTRKLYSSKATYLITSPKNQSSYRKILLPKHLIDILKEYINQFPKLKTSEFLFKGNNPLSETSIYRKLTEYCKLANVKRIRIHDFRHSHASLLISQGTNIVMVAKRLGHTNTEQTLSTYAHLFPSTELATINKLDELF